MLCRRREVCGLSYRAVHLQLIHSRVLYRHTAFLLLRAMSGPLRCATAGPVLNVTNVRVVGDYVVHSSLDHRTGGSGRNGGKRVKERWGEGGGGATEVTPAPCSGGGLQR